MENKVTTDDMRIVQFARQFPETTHAAAVELAELLTWAEANGRAYAAAGLTTEITERAEELVRTKLREAEYLMDKTNRVNYAVEQLVWAVQEQQKEAKKVFNGQG